MSLVELQQPSQLGVPIQPPATSIHKLEPVGILRRLARDVYLFLRYFLMSRATARTMMTPLMICCQYAETLRITRPLLRTSKMKTPIVIPPTVPTPPDDETPPITHAAMASSSYIVP